MKAQTDQQLLRAYAGSHSEAAFAELVRRHIDLVYSAALRMVCDSHQAEDVTQGVFVALARNARQLTHHPVLSGWLHRTTQNLAANAVRANVRRQTREQEAAAMNDLLSAEPDARWEHIAPHLDAALGELSEPDRDAVLLRYFEKKSAQEMAERLGISDEAAQKRVSRAVERLREFFAKRGVTVGASGLVVVISANAVQAAPIGLSAAIATAGAAISGAAIPTATTVGTTKTATMIVPLVQKMLVAMAITSVIGVGIHETRRASSFQAQAQTLQQQQDSLSGDLRQLSRERDEAATKLVASSQRGDQLRLDAAEVPRLRSEVARLQTDSRELAKLKTARSKKQPTKSAGGMLSPGAIGTPVTFAKAGPEPASGGIPPKPDYLVPISNALMEKTNRLRQLFEQMPEKKIAEIKYLNDQSWLWLGTAKGFNLETEVDIHAAMIDVRNKAKQAFGGRISDALGKFIVANNGDLPASLSQLKGYMSPGPWADLAPPDESLLARYKLVHSGKFVDVPRGEWGRMAIETGPPVDKDDSYAVQVGLFGYGLIPRK